MAAQTQDVVRVAYSTPESAPNELYIQLDNTTIYQGSVAIAVAGVARPGASGVAGSTLLGVALQRYEAPNAGTNKTYATDTPMVFKRGVFFFANSVADPCDETSIGKAVYLADNQTFKKTLAANDVSGILRFIQDGQLAVEI